MRLAWAAALVLVACGGAKAEAGLGVAGPAAPPPAVVARGDALAPVAPDVELRGESSAIVAGAPIPFDGVAEGLAWPGLRKALPPKPGATIAITVARDVPVQAVLRAVWTLRDADVRVQTADAAGGVHVIELRRKPESPAAGCHLAVFVTGDGSLRIAAPGGPRVIGGELPGESLARALADEGTRCPIRYVAFGSELPRSPWGRVFDVAWSVARDRSAGDARIVLATPVHLPTTTPAAK